jgi:endonuclease/exonuclease/phosphatase family metal-dependent hydrolase
MTNPTAPRPIRVGALPRAILAGALALGLTGAVTALPNSPATAQGAVSLAPVAAKKSKIKAKIAESGAKSLKLTWNKLDKAKYYRVLVAEDKAFKSRIYTSKWLKKKGSLTITSSKIPWGSTVWVKVRAYVKKSKALATSSPVKAATRKADPLRLREAGQAAKKAKVAWKEATKTTTYEVVASTDKAMKKVVFSKQVKSAVAWISGDEIEEGAKYWVRVTTVDRPNRLTSAKIRVEAGVQTPTMPKNVKSVPLTPTSIKVSWSTSKLATSYVVSLAVNPFRDPVVVKEVDAPAKELTISGINLQTLGLGREFFVRVVADRMGKAESLSSAMPTALPIPPPTGAPAYSVNVGSYNVLREQDKDAKGRTFLERVGLLASRIDDLDVVGVQEATYAVRNGVRPVEAVAEASGLALARDPLTGAACAVHSDHLLYKASRFTVDSCGESFVNTYGGFSRYMAWAVLVEAVSLAPALYVSTHITADKGERRNEERIKETRTIVSLIAGINTAGYPVIFTADLNAAAVEHAFTPPVVLAGAGYVGADLVAPETSYILKGSTHRFISASEVGARLDHIMANSKVVAKEFAVRYGTPKEQPSDHYPIRALLDVYR